MSLLVLVVVALLSLSTVELRKATSDQDLAAARANARMALVQAIGQLQSELGPDQRVSATAGILDQPGSPNWTGVWSTQSADDSTYWIRDEKTGSLIDRRDDEGWDARAEVRSWLVSGGGDPAVPLGREAGVELVGAGSVDDAEAKVRVPLVKLDEQQGRRGGLAWWTGDLGVRANVATADRFAEEVIDPTRPGEAYYRLMVSQHAETEVMGEGIEVEAAKRSSLASANSIALLGGQSRDWSRKHFHDFTTSSRGLLTDVRDGGLKSDLSAYFESDGQISDLGDRPGLSDDESMISGGLVTRHRLAGPRFGMLRDWVRQAVPFAGRNIAARAPATDAEGGRNSEAYAQCNENPVQLIGNTSTSLKPILVEASNFVQISTYISRDEIPVEYQMRHHLYPRVVLWNPYNVEMRSDDMMVMIQGNGRWEMWTENEFFSNSGRKVTDRTPWISFEGGRSTSFYQAESGNPVPLMASAGYNDPYMGSYYFMVPSTRFGPGECLVFSPEGSAEYDGLSVYNSGSYDLSSNRLSCEVAPDPSRSYYVSASDLGGGLLKRPVRFWYAPINIWRGIARDGKNNSNGVENQSDDTRVVVKKLEGSGPVTFERFDELPQVSYISASLQYGAGKEPRIAWDGNRLMDVELLSSSSPSPTLEPDPRTREGIRLRWFEEPLSNVLNSGGLAAQEQFFQEAFFANWNPRAAFSVRSPWENLGGTLPSSGSGGGPWFFGLYTRDLGDSAVGWGSQEPVYRDGRYHGNPFGLPQESSGSHILFELPREETGVVSLGQLQNAQVSQFVWHPSYAIGNSLIDPRLGLEHANRTTPPSASEDEEAMGGFHPDVVGWSSDNERSLSRNEWAETGRAMLQDIPEEDHVVYDLSYELNHTLWDRFFVSSGDRIAKGKFADDPVVNPLPNGRMSLASSTRGLASEERLSDFHRAAYHLTVEGAFNVNSTSVEAWKAMLAATRSASGGEGTPFGRLLDRVAGADGGVGADGQGDLWTSFRMLEDSEIESLAKAIVEEVKLRGPFLSMSDFVNRRLGTDELSRKGALQAAIDKAGINDFFNAAYPINNQETLGDYDHPDNIRDATRLEQTLKPETQAWGAPGFLTQGDVLQVLAPVLSVRSDSFIIRAYGETSNASGEVLARAWCEAVVQRTPVPLKPDATGLNSADLGEAGDFGRRFIVTGFRWLRPDEV